MRWSQCPYIRQAQEEGLAEHGEGTCCFCGRRLTGSRPDRIFCFRADCVMEYQKLYKRWRRDVLTAQGFTQRGTERKRAPKATAAADRLGG